MCLRLCKNSKMHIEPRPVLLCHATQHFANEVIDKEKASEDRLLSADAKCSWRQVEVEDDDRDSDHKGLGPIDALQGADTKISSPQVDEDASDNDRDSLGPCQKQGDQGVVAGFVSLERRSSSSTSTLTSTISDFEYVRKQVIFSDSNSDSSDEFTEYEEGWYGFVVIPQDIPRANICLKGTIWEEPPAKSPAVAQMSL
eukprot:TRINITY_DN14010_c0_g1_i1.p1 TRINITY_DN14010_c0_g1~~TRINITY_DN14010_c0_g1_i1.p1  ORF type:complete len:199 (+),score=30.42 TRINITY_DN14010_c0_g1_i1:100-696(+)